MLLRYCWWRRWSADGQMMSWMDLTLWGSGGRYWRFKTLASENKSQFYAYAKMEGRTMNKWPTDWNNALLHAVVQNTLKKNSYGQIFNRTSLFFHNVLLQQYYISPAVLTFRNSRIVNVMMFTDLLRYKEQIDIK